MVRKRYYLCLAAMMSFLLCCFSFAWGADRGPINSGETKIGINLAGPSYMDTWTFNGQIGDRILINAVTTSGSLDTCITLYPPSGPSEFSTCANQSSCGIISGDQIDYQLKQTGVYTIVIKDDCLSNGGTYNISLLDIPDGPVDSSSDPDGGDIISGETLSGTINVASDMDAFQFDGQIGDRVLITAVATSGSLDTCITLYPPNGGPAEFQTCANQNSCGIISGDQIDYQLKQTGVYTIVIKDDCLSNSGDYKITLLQILDGPINSVADPDGGVIIPGQTLSGTVNVPSDFDVFQFWSGAGARVLINAVATDGSLDTCITLYPPNGGPAEFQTCANQNSCGIISGDKIDYQLQQTGVYTIVIKDDCLANTGKYNITLLKIPGAVNSPEDLDGGSISSGQSLSGTINVPSDMDAFYFYGQATDDRVLITAVKSSGSLDTCITLYPPDGGPAEFQTCANQSSCGIISGDSIDHQLQKTGLYRVVIQDDCFFNKGTYNISMSKVPSTTRSGLYNPFPAVGATVCGHCASFSWDPVAGATGYDLYFGELILSGLPIIAGNLQTPSLPFPEMEDGKVYYWVVIAHTPSGDIWSPVWWFKVSCDIVSDSSWKANTVGVSNWTAKGFDDSGWVYATVWPFGDIAGGVGAPVAPQQISGMEDTVANWIWSGALNYNTMVPEERYFRKTIYLCETPCSGSIRITADNEYHLYVNDGTEVGYGSDYRYAQTYVVTDRLTVGKNVIAVRAYDAYFNEGLLVDGKIMICGSMYTLTVNKAGTGSGAVTSLPTGINCGTDCSEAYNSGKLVTLTAAADSGSTFANWSTNCTVDPLDPKKCTVTIDATKTVTATFTCQDTTPPTGSIIINGGASYTNSTSVMLTLSATDPSGVSQMCISNTNSCSSWISYATSKSWTLTAGEGTKTVYAWFKDGVGNPNTSPYTDTIVLDSTAPNNGTLAATPGNAQVSLNWGGFSDALCGIHNYKLVVSTGGYPNQYCTSGEVIYSGAGVSRTHTGLTNGSTYYYRVCAIDNAGNTSSGAIAVATPGGSCTPKVDLGSVSGNRGVNVKVPVNLTNCAGTDISAVSVDVAYNTSVVTPTGGVIGPAGSAADKKVETNLLSPGLFRVSVFNISNNNIVGNGIVAYVKFDILEGAPLRPSPLDNTPSASDPMGNPVGVDGADGSVNVTACMAGDCDCNGSVSIAEVQSCINMFLKKKPVEPCVDVNNNGSVSIDELMMCINNHMGPTGAVLSAGISAVSQDEAEMMNAIAPSLRLGVKTGEPGDTVCVPLVLRNVPGYEVAAVSTEITFDTDVLENPTAKIGEAGSVAGKDVVYNEGDPGVLTVGVLSTSNNTAIGNGTVAEVCFDIKASAADRTISYLEQVVLGSDPYANPVAMNGNRGIINVITEEFIDVPDGHGAYDYIYTMYNLEITTGYGDNTYRPSQPVTRGQMAAFIIRALFGDDFTYEDTPHFIDVTKASHPVLFTYIQKMYDEGITTGYADGTYRPSQPVTRGQMAAFIIRALFGDDFTYEDTPHFIDVTKASHPVLFTYIQKMYDEGITTGYADGTYRPSQPVIRGQMAAFIIRGFMNVP